MHHAKRTLFTFVALIGNFIVYPGMLSSSDKFNDNYRFRSATWN